MVVTLVNFNYLSSFLSDCFLVALIHIEYVEETWDTFFYIITLSYRYSSLSLYSCFKLTKRLMKELKSYTERCFFSSFCLILDS